MSHGRPTTILYNLMGTQKKTRVEKTVSFTTKCLDYIQRMALTK
jgi:hypothetical protein